MINKEIIIKNVPHKPGVYLWKNKNGNIIYVGKAKDLKNRMLQYFDIKMQNSFKTEKMRQEIADFSTIILSSEREAFIEERKLIDFYKPFYNVLFPTRDSFPYIRVKLLSTNKLIIDIKNHYKKEPNSIYYGPIPDNKNFKPLIRYLNHLLLSKDGIIIEKQSPEFAKQRFEQAKSIMKFGPDFKKNLKQKINEAIEMNLFEQARFYDQILDLLNYNKQSQNIFIKTIKDIDVFGFYQYQNYMLVNVMIYKNGSLVNSYDYIFEIILNEHEFVNQFIDEFYVNNQLPDQIIIPLKYYELGGFDYNDKVNAPLNKLNKNLIDIAIENASNNIEQKIKNYLSKQTKDNEIFNKLCSYLNVYAERIVLFDNSFLSNTNEVIGAACYFKNGQAFKKFYRFYNLKLNLLRNADVEYMQQTSFNYLKDLGDQVDVVIVDGSIGQINEVKKSMAFLNLNIPLFGLVKNSKHETQKLIDSNNNEIKIDDQDVFNLLSRMQTEVDRFAKYRYNQKQRKSMLSNPLLKIKGIGIKTIEKLINYFGSYKKIQQASFDEISKVANKKVAKLICEDKGESFY